MSLLELFNTDIKEDIYNFCTYQVLIMLKMVDKNHYSSVKYSKKAILKIIRVENYLKNNQNIYNEIVNYIDSLGKFRNQIIHFNTFIQYYKHEIDYVNSSISYFLFLYYREFNINIQNCAYPCLLCNKFNFKDDMEIQFLYQICNCKDYDPPCGEQTIISNFQKDFFIEYSVVTTLNFV
jgi:hypothetical protein